jgi:hypothetical protein
VEYVYCFGRKWTVQEREKFVRVFIVSFRLMSVIFKSAHGRQKKKEREEEEK